MNVPTLVTLLRILLVPFIVWAMLEGAYDLAFGAVVAAGLSDALDGYLARRFNLTTDLGAHLDAIADKALLVSVYVTLGYLHVLPSWLVIIVVSRDLLIIGGVVLARLVQWPIAMAPNVLSKVNTVLQIVLAVAVLGMLALTGQVSAGLKLGYVAVAVLTVASGAVYLATWLRHMTRKTGA